MNRPPISLSSALRVTVGTAVAVMAALLLAAPPAVARPIRAMFRVGTMNFVQGADRMLFLLIFLSCVIALPESFEAIPADARTTLCRIFGTTLIFDSQYPRWRREFHSDPICGT
ncbi:hypothetical protein [Streptomyces sp. NBC_00459]|uniref:hypothetical protein n=1 Tax=Streptomyces sp. NBC_00459 TaxID=2975749 RepID=UPI002E18FE8F